MVRVVVIQSIARYLKPNLILLLSPFTHPFRKKSILKKHYKRAFIKG